MIHDEVIASAWPGTEPVHKDEYRDAALLDSAVNRPFQSFGGFDLHRSVYAKAGALFHSLTCNHCFYNGNKRTAIVALDQFLTANSVCLLANNDAMYELARRTASHNANNINAQQALSYVLTFLQKNAVAFHALHKFETEEEDETEDGDHPSTTQMVKEMLSQQRELRGWIRAHPLNRGR